MTCSDAGKVHTADLQDRAAVPQALEGAAKQAPLYVDHGYAGTCKQEIERELAGPQK